MVGYINTLLRYHGVSQDPDSLTDSEWAMRIVHLKNIRKKESEN